MPYRFVLIMAKYYPLYVLPCDNSDIYMKMLMKNVLKQSLKFPPLLKHVCGEVNSRHAGHQEVGRCSTRGGSQGMHITFTSAKQVNKAESTLALKPLDVARNPKQGYQWPPKSLEIILK